MKPKQKKLRELFERLSETDQEALMAFAEFLSARQESRKPEKQEYEKPLHIEPKENESVVGALKRLSACYPMLNKAKLLADTSPFVSQHMMDGRDKKEVIAELELVFQKHYQKLLEGN